MPDPREERTARRIDRIVSQLLAGRSLEATTADAADLDAIRVAARLAGIRDGYPRMSPAFRRRLTGLVEGGEGRRPALNRRSALAAAMGLAAGAVGGVLGAELSGLAGRAHSQPTDSPEARSPVPATSRSIMEPLQAAARWVDTGLRLGDLADGVPRRVSAGAIGAFLVRKGNSVVGMSAYCTHMPCELVWVQSRRVLNCPCHNLAFDIEGESTLQAYPLPALPFVNTRVLPDGRVEVLGT
jgi:cytochrome b6-f complex iron-sulfur subunit